MPSPNDNKWNWPSDEIKRVGYRVVDMISDYLTTLPERPVFQPCPPDLIGRFVDGPLPQVGEGVDTLLDEFAATVAAFPFGNGHPRFFGWVNSPPVEAGLSLVRDGAAMRDAFSLVPPYIRTEGNSAGVLGLPWLSEYGFQQTRGFRAPKVWMALKFHGVDGYTAAIERDLALASRLAQRVQHSDLLQLMAEPSLSIVCFRYAPLSMRNDEDKLNQLNKRLLEAIQLGGTAFLSSTTINGDVLPACLRHQSPEHGAGHRPSPGSRRANRRETTHWPIYGRPLIADPSRSSPEDPSEDKSERGHASQTEATRGALCHLAYSQSKIRSIRLAAKVGYSGRTSGVLRLAYFSWLLTGLAGCTDCSRPAIPTTPRRSSSATARSPTARACPPSSTL